MPVSDKTNKWINKGTKRYISPICPEAPVDVFVPNLIWRSSHRRNQLCRILLQSAQGFQFCRGSNLIYNFPLTWQVAVNTLLALPRSLWSLTGFMRSGDQIFGFSIELRRRRFKNSNVWSGSIWSSSISAVVHQISSKSYDFCRAMLCKRGLCRHFFSPSGSHTILVFCTKRHGNIPTETS